MIRQILPCILAAVVVLTVDSVLLVLQLCQGRPLHFSCPSPYVLRIK